MQELIKVLRGDLIDCKCYARSASECDCGCPWPSDVASEAANLIESQAAEIAELDALRNDAVLLLDKYKALCDQLGKALEWYCRQYEDQESRGILEAWGALK